MTALRTREERDARLNPGAAHVFELNATIYGLCEEREYEMSGRNGITLVKLPHLRVLVEVLREGAWMSEHRSPGPITVQVLEGEIRFSAGDEIVYLRRGELMMLPAGRAHSVEAVQNSAFLLTIAKQPEGDS